jgi:hypothetical protein
MVTKNFWKEKWLKDQYNQRNPGQSSHPISRGGSQTVQVTDFASFDLEVLELVVNDYEAPHTIIEEIARDLGRPVSEAEVLESLLRLVKSGKVQAYLFDRGCEQFRLVNASEAGKTHDLWFMASRKSP